VSSVAKIAIGVNLRELSEEDSKAVVQSLQEHKIQPEFIDGGKLLGQSPDVNRFGGWIVDAQYVVLTSSELKWSAADFTVASREGRPSTQPLVLLDGNNRVIAV
jgi:hypothetical protein